MKRTAKISFLENCRIESLNLSKEQHEIAVDMVKYNPYDLYEYDLKNVDSEMVNVWIADAHSEGDEEYAEFLRKALADGADLFTLVQNIGGFEQELGEIAIY